MQYQPNLLGPADEMSTPLRDQVVEVCKASSVPDGAGPRSVSIRVEADRMSGFFKNCCICSPTIANFYCTCIEFCCKEICRYPMVEINPTDHKPL